MLTVALSFLYVVHLLVLLLVDLPGLHGHRGRSEVPVREGSHAGH